MYQLWLLDYLVTDRGELCESLAISQPLGLVLSTEPYHNV